MHCSRHLACCRLPCSGSAILLDVRLGNKYEASHAAGSLSTPLYLPIQEWDLASVIRRAGFAFFGIYGTGVWQASPFFRIWGPDVWQALPFWGIHAQCVAAERAKALPGRQYTLLALVVSRDMSMAGVIAGSARLVQQAF